MAYVGVSCNDGFGFAAMLTEAHIPAAVQGAAFSAEFPAPHCPTLSASGGPAFCLTLLGEQCKGPWACYQLVHGGSTTPQAASTRAQSHICAELALAVLLSHPRCLRLLHTHVLSSYIMAQIPQQHLADCAQFLGSAAVKMTPLCCWAPSICSALFPECSEFCGQGGSRPRALGTSELEDSNRTYCHGLSGSAFGCRRGSGWCILMMAGC